MSDVVRSRFWRRALSVVGVVAVIGVITFVALDLFSPVPTDQIPTGVTSPSTTASPGIRPPDTTSSPEDEPTTGGGISAWQQGCVGSGPIELTHSPLDLARIFTVVPLGTLAGAHVTPIDHLYFYPDDDDTSPDAYPVYMMGDGHIVEISRRVRQQGSADEREEFRLVIQHTCTFFSYFDLVRVLEPGLHEAFPALSEGDHATGHHFMSGGDVVARIGGQSLDTAVYNTEKPLHGFISPELYEAEFWKIYTDDFFTYFPDSIATALLAKNRRTVEPRSGKIDHDVPGRLVGNWFEEGTNGYAGAPSPAQGDQQTERGYWSGHLAFVPDAFEPAQLKLSIGDYEGAPLQFSVRGNGPDFAEVGPANGVVLYELIEPKFFNSDDPVQLSRNEVDGPTLGVVLVQVLESERLVFQVFPGADRSEVTGFTNDARHFER